MDNTNINTNVAQIILPPDMELRKIKKPKPKTSSEKKKVLKKLKETLKAYDSVVAIAADKKILLPAQLGILPDNIADINSVKELKAFDATLQARIAEINKLIAEGAQKQQTAGLFSEGTGQRLPSMPTRIVPSPIQPTIIQPQVPQTPQPIVPNNQQPPTTQVKDDTDDTEKTLDQIRQEILDKLSPEDREKAEKQLEEETKQQEQQQQEQPQPIEPPAEQPQQPAEQPPQPEPFVFDPTLFVKDLGYDTGGGKRVDIISPIGWTDIYTPYRIYIQDIIGKLQKVDKGVFELPIKDYEALNEERIGIISKYADWSRGLVKKQEDLLDSDPLLKKLNNDMLKELELDPKDIIREIAKAQNIEITEITEGETSLEKEKKKEGLSEAAKDFQNKLKRNKVAFDNIVANIDNLKQNKELDKTLKDLTTEQANIERAFNRLAGPDRVSILSDYNQFELDLSNLSLSVSAKKGDVEIDIDPNTYKHTPKPDAAPAEQDPALPKPKPADAGSAISGGRFIKNKVIVPQKVKGALGRLNKFTLGGATQFTDKIDSSIQIVINEPKLKDFIREDIIQRELNNLPTLPTRMKNEAARQLVKEQILDKILIETN